jgi:hypothetical protein
MKRLLILACLALTTTLAHGCAAFGDGGGGGAGDSSAPPSALERAGTVATQAGAGLAAAGQAVSGVNAPIGLILSAAGGLATAIGGALVRRKATWGTWSDRRAKRSAVWTPEQRQAVRLTLAANEPAPVVAATTGPQQLSSSRIGPRAAA